MILYHFTSRRHLRGIAQHGLTVGDVPTDIQRNHRCVGVWFAERTTPENLGLGGGSTLKSAIRLTVELWASPLLGSPWRRSSVIRNYCESRQSGDDVHGRV